MSKLTQPTTNATCPDWLWCTLGARTRNVDGCVSHEPGGETGRAKDAVIQTSTIAPHGSGWHKPNTWAYPDAAFGSLIQPRAGTNNQAQSKWVGARGETTSRGSKQGAGAGRAEQPNKMQCTILWQKGQPIISFGRQDVWVGPTMVSDNKSQPGIGLWDGPSDQFTCPNNWN